MELHTMVHLVGEECWDFSRCFVIIGNEMGKNTIFGFSLALGPWSFKRGCHSRSA